MIKVGYIPPSYVIEAIDILANERVEKSDASSWMRKENHTKKNLRLHAKKNVRGSEPESSCRVAYLRKQNGKASKQC